MPHEQGEKHEPPPPLATGCAIYLLGLAVCMVWIVVVAIVLRACA
jgi:hypothetical protein